MNKRLTNQRLISVSDLAEILGLSRAATRRATQDLSFPNPVVLPSGTVRWFESEALEWLRSRQAPPVMALDGPTGPQRARKLSSWHQMTPNERRAAGPSESQLASQRRVAKLRAQRTEGEDSNDS